MMVVSGLGQWDPLECETELVYGYIAGLNEASSMVLYLSDAGMTSHSMWLVIPASLIPMSSRSSAFNALLLLLMVFPMNPMRSLIRLLMVFPMNPMRSLIRLLMVLPMLL